MRVLWCAAALLAVAAGGCTRPTAVPAKVAGVVTFQGRPVGGGSVTYVADSGEKFTSALGKDGDYSIKDMPAGDYRVAVETDTVKAAADAAASEKGRPGVTGMTSPRPKNAAPVEPVKYVAIPKKYAAAAGSGLNVTLKKGANTFNPELN